jgi:hypothetical protein
MTYEMLVSALTVKPIDEPIYSERATTVRIDDEAAGPFVVVEQHGRDDIGKITIDIEEWPVLKNAIDRMIELCRTIAPQ